MYNTPDMNRMKEKQRKIPYLYLFLGLGLVAIVASVISFVVLQPKASPQWKGYSRSTVSFDTGQTLDVVIADTQEKRTQGLSDSVQLALGTGMLFVFENERNNGFWMKDMNYPIDIFWFDREYQIVHTQRNVSPDTFPTTFGGDVVSQYVLETNVGELPDVQNILIHI